MEGGKMNGGRVWSWASSLFIVLCRHIVLVVSSLCGRVVVPLFCVLVVVSSSHVHRLSWACHIVVMVVVVWCGRRVVVWSWC